MSVFRVGMRVRVVKADYPENLGREAVIRGLYVVGDDGEGGKYIGHLLDFKNRFGVDAIVCPSCLEPILDRPELSTWDEVRKLGIDVHAAAREVA